MRKIIIAIVVLTMIAGAFMLSSSKKGKSNTQKTPGNIQQQAPSLFDGIANMCNVFPLEEVNKLTGKSFERAEPFKSNDGKTYNCEYFQKNHFIIIDLGLYDVEGQKKGYEVLDRKISTDPRITMDHFMVHSGKSPEEISDIYLILDKSHFVRVGKSSVEAMSNDELILLAQNMTSILQGKKPYIVPKTDKVVPTTFESKNSDPLLSEQSVARTFLEFISNNKIDDALSSMSPEMLGDDSQKQLWGVQLNSFSSLKVNSVEDSLKETWTNEMQQFKVVVDVRMKPEAANAPIPNYGWENGENIRWIIIKKVDGKWKVDSISTGP